MFTTSGNTPGPVDEALSDDGVFKKLRVGDLVAKVASLLDRATLKIQGHLMDFDDDDEGFTQDEPSEDEEEDLEDDDEAEFGHFDGNGPSPLGWTRMSLGGADTEAQTPRIHADLRKVKEAGFRVSSLGDIGVGGQNSFVLISCRVAKLEIAEDALKAWNLERHEYIMLLLHFSEGYKTLKQLMEPADARVKHGLRFHVGVAQRYKIPLSEAVRVFANLESKKKAPEQPHGNEAPRPEQAKCPMVRSLFIGRPINELLNTRLLDVIKYRMSMALPWKGAETFYNDYQGRNWSSEDVLLDKYHADDGPNFSKNLPDLAKHDEIDSSDNEKSFPLVAFQFMLRHLVRCTDFCLVCHRRVETDFEALKPFVCSNPLCLYQYMSLGFGPSIEYEILTQPYVVDLLVSFAWSSANSLAMKERPLGMNLHVPPVTVLPNLRRGSRYYVSYPQPTYAGEREPADTGTTSSPLLQAHWNPKISELVFEELATRRPDITVGTWVVLCMPNKTHQHRKIIETAYYPRVRVGPPVTTPKQQDTEEPVVSRVGARYSRLPAVTTPPSGEESVPKSDLIDIAVYDTRLDDLDHNGQQDAIRIMLDTLPSVLEMKSYLEALGDKQMTLQTWTDRISPAALGILRFTIASNRSCLVQTDNLDGSTIAGEDRVVGMDTYLQFRFAQGAPDKEQRFIDSVRETTQRLKLRFPTMFVWHGSPLQNWHGIIREGLKFEQTLHGRAFGNGVYFSKQASTSVGYTGGLTSGYGSSNNCWPSSLLKITSALCLAEVVNAPSEFVSNNPHFVVNKLDWIQTRYLFIATGSADHKPTTYGNELPLTQILEQDPSKTSSGITNLPIVIPITAISKSRRPVAKPVKTGNKRVKVVSEGVDCDSTFISDESDPEDVQLWRSSADSPMAKSTRSLAITAPLTDFVPGKLDFSTLPRLAQPSYATSRATKTLQKLLQAVLKTQETTPAHELGWYLEPEHIDNVYQWIVELHSFDAALPLAADLKARGSTSVVLELRFGATFPFSPPFVRVVRPRFLPFLSGGGGHVTAGGALCMELLTNSGWNAASSIESVLLQVRLAMSSTEPKPARLDPGPVRDYSAGEAMDAYRRACITHGWKVPEDFNAFSSAGGTASGSGGFY